MPSAGRIRQFRRRVLPGSQVPTSTPSCRHGAELRSCKAQGPHNPPPAFLPQGRPLWFTLRAAFIFPRRVAPNLTCLTNRAAATSPLAHPAASSTSKLPKQAHACCRSCPDPDLICAIAIPRVIARYPLPSRRPGNHLQLRSSSASRSTQPPHRTRAPPLPRQRKEPNELPYNQPAPET